MFELFYEGGVLFMGLLTLILLIIFCLAVTAALKLLKEKSFGQVKPLLAYIKSLALFALVTGILGQLIGLYSAMEVLQQEGGIAPHILAYGFRVSSICNIYGFLIFLTAYLLWFGLHAWMNRQLRSESSS